MTSLVSDLLMPVNPGQIGAHARSSRLVIEVTPPLFPLVIPLATVKDFVIRRLYAFIICRVAEIATRRGRANIARFLRIGA